MHEVGEVSRKILLSIRNEPKTISEDPIELLLHLKVYESVFKGADVTPEVHFTSSHF